MSSQAQRPPNAPAATKGEVVVTAAPPAPAEQQQHQVQRHQSSKQSPNIIGSHYKVGKKIGEGSFGVIYEGVSLLNHSLCAIKFEPRKSDAPQLRDEFRTYKILQGTQGVPNVHYFGQEGLHNILCIDLLGPSMEDMFDLCGRKFSIKTVCMAAKQMLTRIQSVHEKNLIYRDIKPDNFLVGRLPRSHEPTADVLKNHSSSNPHSASQLYLVDFGMAKQYRDPKTKVHIPYREKKSLSGTARYMSINTHLGREQSRRDDLEALGHVFLYFTLGSLPWQGLKAATNKQKYEKIGEKKQSTSIKDLCEGYPEEFGQYLTYARNLKFDEQPDYDFLRGLFNKGMLFVSHGPVLQKRDMVDDGVFDWMLVMDKQRRERERRKEQERQAQLLESANAEAGANGTSAFSASMPYPQHLEPQSASLQPHHTNFGTSVSGNVLADSQAAHSPISDTANSGQQPPMPYKSPLSEEVVGAKSDRDPMPATAQPTTINEASQQQQQQKKKKKKGGIFACCMGSSD